MIRTIATPATLATLDSLSSNHQVVKIPREYRDVLEEFPEVQQPRFEGACVNNQDGTKYSKLLSLLTPEARSRMVGHLPEPGTHNDGYQQLKAKLKEAYTKTKMERCTEMMSISSLRDRNPEHLLS